MLSKAVDYLMQGMAPQLSQSKQALIGDLREETWGKALMFLFQKEIITISKETKTNKNTKKWEKLWLYVWFLSVLFLC